jgi:hypothetical protein
MTRRTVFTMMAIRNALAVTRRYRADFVSLNFVFFGLFGIMMATTLAMPTIQQEALQLVSSLVRTDVAAKIYLSGNIAAAVSATFMVNLIVAGLISLSSLIVPFVGVALAFLLAAVYGMTLAPVGPHAAAMIPHSVAIAIEFEAYVIAALGAYIVGQSTFFPVAGARHPIRRRYRDSVLTAARLYVLIIPLLALGAVYEVFEILLLVRFFA